MSTPLTSADDQGELRRRREVVTPEGVPLVLSLATAGDRVAAFLLDMLLVIAATAVVAIIAGLLFANESGWLQALVTLLVFLLRNFYFIWFELKWQGRTPGKRYLGIRVVDAAGGMLTSRAIFVRNLTREIEVFIPLAALAQPEAVFGPRPGWVTLASILWLAVFALLPLFNRDHMRIGDVIAGTLVVRAPKAVLLGDLSTPSAATPDAAISFTAKELDVYGIYELQVLEDVLRDQTDPRALTTVARKIQRKIGWEDERGVSARQFLAAFYKAQRAHLEQRMLLGRARERKQ